MVFICCGVARRYITMAQCCRGGMLLDEVEGSAVETAILDVVVVIRVEMTVEGLTDDFSSFLASEDSNTIASVSSLISAMFSSNMAAVSLAI